ncbi:MAG: site-specific integrase, partial [Bacilli bacterium]
MKNDVILKNYLNYLLVEKCLSDNSIKRSIYCISNFFNSINKDISNIDINDINSYLNSLYKIKKSTSINNIIS